MTARTPEVAVIRVIEIRFLRGAGDHFDPVRSVVALFTENGEPIVELDPFKGDVCPARSAFNGAWCQLRTGHSTTHFDGRDHNWNDPS